MAIDTSREAVERMANDLRRAGHSGNFGILPVALALLAERDAALAEVARLSQALAAETAKREAMEAALTAADLFFREAMPKMNIADSCLSANEFAAWNAAEIAVRKARATIAKHGSKT